MTLQRSYLTCAQGTCNDYYIGFNINQETCVVSDEHMSNDGK